MACVTVIVPVYNVEPYIKRCVDSILSQTFEDFEIVLIDDGSTDKSGTICEEYAKKDARIIAIHQNNQGLSAARNSGINWAVDNSNSKWISFVDSDDWVHIKYLENLYKAVFDTGLSVAVCDYIRSNGEEIVIDDSKLNVRTIKPEDLYCANYVRFITAWGKIYKKSDFKNLRYPLGKIHEDEFITWKLMLKHSEIAAVEQFLYAYYVNDTGIIRSKWSINRLSALDAFEERLIWFSKNPKYSEAHSDLHKKYLWHILYAVKQLKQTPERKKELSEVNRKLRKFLKIEKMSISEYDDLYKIAYPNTFRIKFAFFKVKNMF